MIKITVPATSANLGIGYDTLGMAVSLYSHFTFERSDELEITGCPVEFQSENNLVYVSFVDALREWGEAVSYTHLSAASRESGQIWEASSTFSSAVRLGTRL